MLLKYSDWFEEEMQQSIDPTIGSTKTSTTQPIKTTTKTTTQPVKSTTVIQPVVTEEKYVTIFGKSIPMKTLAIGLGVGAFALFVVAKK